MGYSRMRPDGVAMSPVITSSVSERLQYIQKVYTLTFFGLLVFFGTIALPITGLNADIPVLSQIAGLALSVAVNPIGNLICLALLIGSSFLVHSVSMVKGWNLVAYFALSVLWGFLTIPLVIYASAATTGGVTILAPVIYQALGLTVLVFGGLTAYVFITRQDFSFIGGFLMVGMFLVLGAIVVNIVMAMMGMQVEWLSTAISMFLILLMAGYVLYDTSNILHHYATDMVVPGALALMVDFIIMFRSILYLLVVSRD